jgi:hypothetical protein
MSIEHLQAEAALRDLEKTWLKIINEINKDKTRQIPREEGNRIRKNCNEDIMQFGRIYTPEIDTDRNFGLDLINTNSRIYAHLDIALLEGKRRYENEIHKRRIEIINALGVFFKNVGLNIGFLLAGILTTFLGFKFSGYCP